MRFWKAPGEFWEPSWVPKPNKIGGKSRPRAIPSWTSLFDRIFVDFGSIFGGFSLPTWRQVGMKIDQKSTLTSKGNFSRKPIKTNGFSMFFKFSAIEVRSKNVTKLNQKLHQKREASWHRFCIPFGPNLGRFWSSKSMKNRCREGSKTDHFFGRFWYRFLMLFGYVLVANLPPT